MIWIVVRNNLVFATETVQPAAGAYPDATILEWDGPEPILGDPPPGPSWDVIRARRNRLLAASDYTQAPDSPLSAEEKLLWQIYRSLLRDITSNYASPGAVVWPPAPA